VVDIHHWITAPQFGAMFALAQAAPGPNMMVVTLIGWHVAGWQGVLVTSLATFGPSSRRDGANDRDGQRRLRPERSQSACHHCAFYDALNQPATKDVAALLVQSTSPTWVSCGGNDACLPREKVIAAFKKRGEDVPDLAWKIVELVVAGDRVIVRGEGSGTPKTLFLGVQPGGKAFRVMAIDIHNIADDKMVRSYHVEDWAGAIRQLTAQ